MSDFWSQLHEHGIDFRRRRVFLRGDIPHPTSSDSGRIIQNILALDERAAPIELWLSTPGGDFDEMWAIYDVMKTAKNPIITVALGNVSSAGCLLLAGGTGQRYAMPHASMMWHGSEGGSEGGGPGAILARAEWLKYDQGRWTLEMARNTGRACGKNLAERQKFWESHTKDSELWLDAKGMIKHGIVDQIWTKE